MGKKIYWILVGLVALAGVTTMIYYGIQPRPIPKIKISKFESHTVLANAMLLRLREEIKNSPVLFLGVDPDKPEHYEIWKEFLKHDQEAGMSYDTVVMDHELQSDVFADVQKVETKDDVDGFAQGIQNALQQAHRVAVIVPTSYAVQMIHQNFATRFNAKVQVQATSFSLTDFPRAREQEKDMPQKCIVEGVDQTGLGPFGCLIMQSARANYRKRFETGETIGFVNQIGMRDYLVFYTREK